MEIDTLKQAFRKLLTYTYFDKSNMVLRHAVALFVKKWLQDDESENQIFNDILRVCKGEDPSKLNIWLNGIRLELIPKKVSSTDVNNVADCGNVVSNIPFGKPVINKIVLNSIFPVELLIIDIAWLMKYGFLTDANLTDSCFGNRLDLIADNSGIRKGNSLFKRYHVQYQNWWRLGVEKANEVLNDGAEDVTIINFDISNCYHSIDFDFEVYLTSFEKYKSVYSKVREDNLTQCVLRMYEQYWRIINQSQCLLIKWKRPLPLGLFSSHVFANWYLSTLESYIKFKYSPIYFGRYVDDCMLVLKTKSHDKMRLQDILESELPDFFLFDKENIFFKIDKSFDPFLRCNSLRIQKEKLFVYKFNCKLPAEGIDKYVSDQIERSSEFRFLTDDGNIGSSLNLENITLVNALDADETNGSRFSILGENAYKLSVYLSKLASRLSRYPKDDKLQGEVTKVFRYFQGPILIKYFSQWEKLLTIFTFAERHDYLSEMMQRVINAINETSLSDEIFSANENEHLDDIKRYLRFYLEQCRLLAASLYPCQETDRLYLDTYLVRRHYNIFPLQEFTVEYKQSGLYTKECSNIDYIERCWDYNWMPYHVKYYEIVSALALGKVFDPDIYKHAYGLFTKLNRIPFNDWDAIMFHEDGKTDVEFNVDIRQDQNYAKKIVVSVVEMKITQPGIEEAPVINADKINLMQSILDKITDIPSTNIFILPELALPIYMLKEYCQYSAKNEIAFVSGLEYYQKGTDVFNYIVTCLPITLYGQRDAIPIIRLKNFYAPKELQKIEHSKRTIPKNDTKWQILYHFNNHVFTSYYCFELTSVIDRSYFFGKIDAMYCSVFNKDTYYFNNIAEACSRDMHCYFILCNTSDLGDSRVTQPTSHMTMNLMKVKGGNTTDNKAIVLSTELDIEGLRDFQKMNLDQQGENNNRFKFTSPCLTSEMVRNRERRFILCDENKQDDIESLLKQMSILNIQY